jgi:hypothetical protein
MAPYSAADRKDWIGTMLNSPTRGLDAVAAADLSQLIGMPAEPRLPGDLRDTAGAGPVPALASPLTTEIVSAVVAAVTAAVLVQQDAVPRPADQVPPGGWSVAAAGRRSPAGGGPPLPAVMPGRPESVGRSLAQTPPAPPDGQLCAMFGVDIVGFTRPDRDDDIRRYLHEELYIVLRKAFDACGLPWDSCCWEDRGDGALVVIPAAVGYRGLVDRLPRLLRDLVRRQNHVCRTAAHLQLRAAAHLGPVEHDGHGFVSSDVNFLFRMLEAGPLRRALAASGAEVGMIVSDDLHRILVGRGPRQLGPDEYQLVRFQVKRARFRAWSYLPDGR